MQLTMFLLEENTVLKSKHIFHINLPLLNHIESHE